MGLAYIDTHTAAVGAPPSATWQALVSGDRSGPAAKRRERFARLLGCVPAGFSGAGGEAGSTAPGFRVARAEPPRELALEGRHHFSDYRLDFQIEENPDGGTILSAITHADFPGLRGEIYKTLVIRSRAHVVATRRMLESVRRRAEDGKMNS